MDVAMCALCGEPIPEKRVRRHAKFCSKTCGRRAVSRRYADRHRERERERKQQARTRAPERQREYNRRYRERHPGRSAEACRRWRAKNPGYSTRWSHENPELASKYQRRYAQKHPEVIADKASRRRARARSAPVVEKIDRLAIYERDGGRCHLCNRHVPRKKFTLDHLVPLARGGDHTPANVRVAHLSCNSRRGVDRMPAQLLLVP